MTLLLALLLQEEIRLQSDFTKGQKFAVTADLEFVGEAATLEMFGLSKLHARLEVAVKDASTFSTRFLELSGKGTVKPGASRWSYDLQWKAGVDFGRTVIGHLPLKETEEAMADLDEAFKAEWIVTPKGLDAALAGKTETFSFLKSWAPSLFTLPAPLPFAGRVVRKGLVFEEGGFTWTVDEIVVEKESKVATVSGKGKERTAKLAVDSRGFVSSIELLMPGKEGEKPLLKAVLTCRKQS